jgi:peptidoglycan hydrolase CwlO-like protein
MNGLIVLLIILLGALILNQVVNNFSIVEGLDLAKCDPKVLRKVKESSAKNSREFKTLQKAYGGLKMKVSLMKDQDDKLQDKMDANKEDKEKTDKELAENEEKIRNAKIVQSQPSDGKFF